MAPNCFYNPTAHGMHEVRDHRGGRASELERAAGSLAPMSAISVIQLIDIEPRGRGPCRGASSPFLRDHNAAIDQPSRYIGADFVPRLVGVNVYVAVDVSHYRPTASRT
jgi:hypothetical protein